MKEIREILQTELNKIKNLESGEPIADDIIEDDKFYFGYQLQEVFNESNLDLNYSMKIFLNGRLVSKDNPTKNTLEQLDMMLEEIKKALKKLQFKYSYEDITMDNGIRKILITGYVYHIEKGK